jgi:hypothetical protein
MGDGGDGLRVGQHRGGCLGARQRRVLSLGPSLGALKLFTKSILEERGQRGDVLFIYVSGHSPIASCLVLDG